MHEVKLDWQQAYLRRVFDLENVELTAIFRGFQLCARIGIHKLILDGDCLFMIKECLSSATSFSTIGSLITEIKKLQDLFVECQFQQVYRDHKRPAHLLARSAWNLDTMIMWESVPNIVSQAI